MFDFKDMFCTFIKNIEFKYRNYQISLEYYIFHKNRVFINFTKKCELSYSRLIYFFLYLSI